MTSAITVRNSAVSVLYREPKLLKFVPQPRSSHALTVSVLYREPKLLKYITFQSFNDFFNVSVLYREPKLLKSTYRSPS